MALKFTDMTYHIDRADLALTRTMRRVFHACFRKQAFSFTAINESPAEFGSRERATLEKVLWKRKMRRRAGNAFLNLAELTDDVKKRPFAP